jgi:hypothetical protein
MSDIVERLRAVKTAECPDEIINAAEDGADEIEKLRDAINAALTEKTPMEGGLWSQEPIGPNETPAEAIKRLIKFRVDTGCIVERDAFKDEIEKLRAAICEWAASIYGYEGVLFLEGLKHEEFINSILDEERDRIEAGEKQ